MKNLSALIENEIRSVVHSEIKTHIASKSNQEVESKTYSESEAAAYLKRSKTTMWRLRRDGAISYTKYGAKVVYTEDDLKQFLNNNRVDRS